jgi:hypothetical protein
MKALAYIIKDLMVMAVVKVDPRDTDGIKIYIYAS